MSTPRWNVRLYSISLFILVLLALGAVYVLPNVAQTGRTPQATHAPGGEASSQYVKAPDFALERMNGETFRLSDHRGEVVVVNFWATWCPPCRFEIPGFIQLQEEYGEEGLTFVGVSLDQQGFAAVRPYAEKMGINYPLVVDDGAVASKYGGVRVLPSTFVVGPEGKIRFARRGILSEVALRKVLQPLLKKAE